MRTRWLKPEFFRDRKMGTLGPIKALVYQALWIVADDGGTAMCNPEQLAGEMFCYWPDVGLPEIDAALRELAKAGRIERFAVGDEHYCRIVNWEKHQRVHNPSAFRHPVEGQPLSVDADVALRQDLGSTEAVVPPPSPPRHLDTQTPDIHKQKETWLTPFVDAWEKQCGGKPVVGKLIKPLDSLVKAHGSPVVEAAWGRYLKATDSRYLSASDFAAKFGQWHKPRTQLLRDVS